MTDDIAKLNLEIEGLRLQLASKEEVLERCLSEIDRLSSKIKILEAQNSATLKPPEVLGRKATSYGHNSKILPDSRHKGGLENHCFNPLDARTCDKKQELKPSCKITMGARISKK